MPLPFIIFALSLFDSLSTTQQIIIFALLLTTLNPIRNSLAYLAGLSGSYFLCGILGFSALDRLQSLISRFFPSTANFSDPMYYLADLVSGLVFIIIGIIYYKKQINSKKPSVENIIISRLKHMNVFFAAGIGVFISVTSFPFSIPYIVALGKLATLKLNLNVATSYIFLYNIGYALPMIIIFGIYLYARRGAENIHGRVVEKTRLLNIRLTTWMFAGLRALSVIDSLMFFITGHSLIKGRYF